MNVARPMVSLCLRGWLAATPFLLPARAPAQVPGPLADLEWMSGAWALERGGERLEERWSGPDGDSMVGHFRWVRGGELWITELQSITADADGIRFRLRHFGRDMRPWESVDDPFVYRLALRAPGRVSFEIEEERSDRPRRFTFEALPGDSLLVRLEEERDGTPVTRDFRYARIP